MQLEYDREQNTLKVALTSGRIQYATKESRQGIIDVVEGGRLLGVEISPATETRRLKYQWHSWLRDDLASQHLSIDPDGRAYIELSNQGDNNVVRSSEILVILELDSRDRITAISFPRRAAGYEISYPSGNR